MFCNVLKIGSFFFIFFPFLSHCQEKDEPESIKNLSSLLCHRWGVGSKIYSSVEHIKEFQPAESISTISFSMNGTVLIDKLFVVKGRWSYDMRSSLLRIDMSGRKLKYKILKITDNEMILKEMRTCERTKEEHWVRVE